MESAEQADKNLRTNVSNSLVQTKHPASPVDLNPASAESHLANVADILSKSAGHAVSIVKTEEPTTYVETVSGGKGLAMIRAKLGRLFQGKKAA